MPTAKQGKGAQQVTEGYRGGWRGSVPDGDRAIGSEKNPRMIVNCRLENSRYVRRKGQFAALQSPLTSEVAEVRFLADFQLATRKSLYFSGDGCPDISVTEGGSIAWYDQEQEPTYQAGIYYPGATTPITMARFGDDLMVGNGTNLRVFQRVDGVWGSYALSVSGGGQDIPLHDFDPYDLGPMLAFDGKLFIGLDGGSTARVGTWDGVTGRDDDLTGLSVAPAGMGLFREVLVVGLPAGGSGLRIRATGDTPSWSTVAPSGSSSWDGYFQGESYRDVFYFTTGVDGVVWSWDGASGLAPFHTISGAAVARGIKKFNGKLYVAYTTDDSPSPAGEALLAEYDGETNTWADAKKNFTQQNPQTILYTRKAMLLEVFRGCLVCYCVRINLEPTQLFISPLDDVGSAMWKIIAPSGGGINQMLTY